MELEELEELEFLNRPETLASAVAGTLNYSVCLKGCVNYTTYMTLAPSTLVKFCNILWLIDAIDTTSDYNSLMTMNLSLINPDIMPSELVHLRERMDKLYTQDPQNIFPTFPIESIVNILDDKGEVLMTF